ncbi:MAG TPA: adenylate/guanylate cyclase domain-containing protein [Phycisphaerae bacterium]|nr:adenylate/guanylate cyclase domain-containing protein [Phycisphaerae bacterium]
MAEGAARTSRPVSALLLGLTATVVVVAGDFSGLARWLELGSLDVRFRLLSTAPPTNEIATVNIDDGSLEELGRWPWPRELLAGVVDALQLAGARAVALDIIMPEPQETRYVSTATEVYSGESGAVLSSGPPRAVWDDRILTETIRRYPNTFLPMHVSLDAPPPSPLEKTMEGVMAAEPGLSLAEASGKVRARLFAADANASFLGKDTRHAYLRARAMQVLQRFGVNASQAVGYPLRTGAIVPPLFALAEATRHTGFVTFDPDGDGIVRRIPLLVSGGGRIYPQFALSLAAEELARRRGGSRSIAADARGVSVDCGGELLRRVPTDREGCLLINWMRTKRGRWQHPQVSATLPGTIHRLGEEIGKNADHRRVACVQLVELYANRPFRTPELEKLYFELVEAFVGLDQTHFTRAKRQAERVTAILYDPAHVPAPVSGLLAKERQLEQKIDRLMPKLFAELRNPEYLDWYLGKPAASNATTAAADDQNAAFLIARAKAKAMLRYLDELSSATERHRRRQQELKAQLRREVAGRICLVGSTATGAADFVPTPMHPRTPGVFVHANIANTILSGRFVRQAHWAVNLLAILLAGLAVSLLASSRPVWQSGPMMVGLAAAYVAFSSLVMFALWDVWLVMVAPVAAMFFSFLVVTAYRQLTEERAKRHIRGLFAHALSPALVDRLIAEPSLMRLGGERRVLSCFFSDIAGFTPLSERLGEQGTVHLLNRYFDRMTDVIQNRNGGYLNKFLGDGLFVFFGAPVFQDDHAARAVRAALDCQAELNRFNEELGRELGGQGSLRCRIGVATGEVMVGNCGSSERMDYTAIGDTVNLASRLEGANKSFGTRILVDGQTWELFGGDGVVARSMGKVLVVGKAEPVAVWNPLGRRGEVAEATEKAAADFTAAVALFIKRRFGEAAEQFEALLRASPDDQAAQLYLDLCRQYAADAPGPDWDGAIQLTQK